MSFEAVLWATTDAPIADVNEFAVLVMLAEKADSDGCSAFPSRPTMADRTKIDPKTVLRTLQRLEQRRLIRKGDQSAAAYIRKDRRPVVWDLLIPYGWFPNIERINKERQERGKAPLTPELRPPIAAPPAKARRSDLGKKRPRKDVQERGDCESPREDGASEGHGVTVSPARGDCESVTGGLRDTRTCPLEPVLDPVLPSAGNGVAAVEGEGRTDPRSLVERAAEEGVRLLQAIAAERPEFLLTGKTLTDQGFRVATMLGEGWTPEQIRQVVAGRPLPQPVKTSVGAVVAGRLRDALAAPPPSKCGPVPTQAAREDAVDAPTPTPDPWAEEEHVRPHRLGECAGRDGFCGRPLKGRQILVGLCAQCEEASAAGAERELTHSAP